MTSRKLSLENPIRAFMLLIRHHNLQEINIRSTYQTGWAFPTRGRGANPAAKEGYFHSHVPTKRHVAWARWRPCNAGIESDTCTQHGSARRQRTRRRQDRHGFDQCLPSLGYTGAPSREAFRVMHGTQGTAAAAAACHAGSLADHLPSCPQGQGPPAARVTVH
jgi:hypothetical protein